MASIFSEAIQIQHLLKLNKEDVTDTIYVE